jgi:hypothetical protein
MTLKHRRALHGIAAAIGVCALAAPTASAVPSEQFLQDAKDRSAGSATSATPVPVRVVTVPDGGFDWGDAGIGASGVLALAAIGAGAAIATGHRRGHRQLPQPAAH